jgi:lipooligosaccharide transport system permease protein
MATPGAFRVVEWNWLAYRRIWKGSVVSSFAQPLLYLLGMGLGVGTLVKQNAGSSAVLGGVGYARFIAPGLLATTAMIVGSIESTWPVFVGFKWQRLYHAMAATPLDALDIVLGLLLWVGFRVVTAAGSVALAMELIPSTRSAALPLAVLAAGLCGLAFAMPLAAYAASVEQERGFVALQRFGITPMLLFAGTFYPVSQLPAAVRPLAYVTPVWHGVELCRGLTLHTLGAGAAIGHVAYLLAFVVVGTLVSVSRFTRRLAS